MCVSALWLLKSIDIESPNKYKCFSYWNYLFKAFNKTGSRAITRRGQKGHGPLKWNLFHIKHFCFHLIFSYVTNIFLLIAVPPSKIEISGVNPGSRMTIRENEMVELRCVVHNAKPKATIVWFRKNTEYLTGKSKRFLSYWYLKQ